MATYQAPLRDMRFVLHELLDARELAELPGYEQATPELVDAVLEGKAAAPNAASVREEDFADAEAGEEAKPARRAPAKKGKKGDDATA